MVPSALTVDSNGNVYAGGDFHSISGVNAAYCGDVEWLNVGSVGPSWH